MTTELLVTILYTMLLLAWAFSTILFLTMGLRHREPDGLWESVDAVFDMLPQAILHGAVGLAWLGYNLLRSLWRAASLR